MGTLGSLSLEGQGVDVRNELDCYTVQAGVGGLGGSDTYRYVMHDGSLEVNSMCRDWLGLIPATHIRP